MTHAGSAVTIDNRVASVPRVEPPVARTFAIVLLMHMPVAAEAGNAGFMEREINCLARNVYFEARNQPIEGQLAVAYVTLNRLDESKTLSSICEVVYRPGWFSWTRDRGTRDHRITEKAAWATARKIAKAAIAGRAANPVQGSTFFHSVSVAPNWASMLIRVEQIGDHIFYARPQSKARPTPAERDAGDDANPSALTWTGQVAGELALQPEIDRSRFGHGECAGSAYAAWVISTKSPASPPRTEADCRRRLEAALDGAPPDAAFERWDAYLTPRPTVFESVFR